MRATLGILCTLLLGVLAGCARPAGAAGASPTPDAYQAGVKYSQCMRSHGVNIPDPQTVSGSGGGMVFSVKVTPGAVDQMINPDSAQFKAAQNACKHLLPNGGTLSAAQQAQMQQDALKFARCMRAHGVDVPDPQPGSGGLVIRGSGPNSGSSSGGSGDVSGPRVRPDDPKFQAAQKACGSLLGKPVGGGGGPVLNQTGG